MSSAASSAGPANGSSAMGRKSQANGSSSRPGLRPLNGAAKRPRGIRRKTPQPEKVPQPVTMDSIMNYVVNHQISLCSFPLAILLTLHFSSAENSELHQWTKKFYSVSYLNPRTGLYGKGSDDAYLVFFWVVVFTLLRVCLMDYVASPYARFQGMSRKGAVRFAEQAWSFAYYTISFSVGMRLMVGSKYWFNLRQLWTDWPLRELDGSFKWYYLVQFACWVQQIFILHIEARRKDHYQMLAHHIITCALIYCSYVYHMTRVGHVILCLFDVGDILLAGAKMLKYMKYQTICDCAFGLFVLSWLLCRHIFFTYVIMSAQSDSTQEIPFGCFETDLTSYVPYNESSPKMSDMFIRPQQTVCFNRSIQAGFVGLLWALQGLMVMWFYLIIKVVIKVLMGVGAEDNRSDDEAEEEIDEVGIEMEVANGDLKLMAGEAYAEASGSAMGSGARRRREGVNGTPLRDVFIGGTGKNGQSQFSAAQKLAESKIGCGGDDR
ncbi:hypothetical protein ABW19_dt0204622 [Dactylella cylindrospora]|nr:hypothetical protein ABW19_dt0204622 [Dactylella cylindrospora]